MIPSAILVFNKIRPLGKVTQGQLLDRGFTNVISTDTFDQASEVILTEEGKVVLIMELTPSWNKQAEIDFLNKMKKKHKSKLVLFLCTTEELNSDVQDQFKNMGIAEFIFQRFDLQSFGKELEEAIKKFSPQSLNLA